MDFGGLIWGERLAYRGESLTTKLFVIKAVNEKGKLEFDAHTKS